MKQDTLGRVAIASQRDVRAPRRRNARRAGHAVDSVDAGADAPTAARAMCAASASTFPPRCTMRRASPSSCLLGATARVVSAHQAVVVGVRPRFERQTAARVVMVATNAAARRRDRCTRAEIGLGRERVCSSSRLRTLKVRRCRPLVLVDRQGTVLLLAGWRAPRPAAERDFEDRDSDTIPLMQFLSVSPGALSRGVRGAPADGLAVGADCLAPSTRRVTSTSSLSSSRRSSSGCSRGAERRVWWPRLRRWVWRSSSPSPTFCCDWFADFAMCPDRRRRRDDRGRGGRGAQQRLVLGALCGRCRWRSRSIPRPSSRSIRRWRSFASHG